VPYELASHMQSPERALLHGMLGAMGNPVNTSATYQRGIGDREDETTHGC
jgi:hypothetical protein